MRLKLLDFEARPFMVVVVHVDSHYHDTPEAKIKDNMKNNIFDVAYIPLHRVRLQEFTNTPRHEFVSKIKKLIEAH
jgi:hypothetical protein